MPEKYSLRPRSNIRRIESKLNKDESCRRRPMRSSSSNSRPPPLSKYRRKSANARERHRMKEINNAFAALRRILPDFCSRRTTLAMTKITTLKVAVSYIRALSHLLEDEQNCDMSLLNCVQMNMPMTGGAHDTYLPIVHDVHNVIQELPERSSLNSTQISSSPSSSCSYKSEEVELQSDPFSDESDDLFTDTIDAFDDIPVLPEVESYALLMTAEEMFMLES